MTGHFSLNNIKYPDVNLKNSGKLASNGTIFFVQVDTEGSTMEL